MSDYEIATLRRGLRKLGAVSFQRAMLARERILRQHPDLAPADLDDVEIIITLRGERADVGRPRVATPQPIPVGRA